MLFYFLLLKVWPWSYYSCIPLTCFHFHLRGLQFHRNFTIDVASLLSSSPITADYYTTIIQWTLWQLGNNKYTYCRFLTGSCLIQHDSIAENSHRSFLQYYSAVLNSHLSWHLITHLHKCLIFISIIAMLAIKMTEPYGVT